MLNNAKYRAAIYQVLTLFILATALYGMWSNLQDNLTKQGIASGFGFLSNTAGFGISTHLIDYHEGMSYGRVFWVGLLNTVVVSITGIIAATLLGFIIGLFRLSSNFLVNRLALTYIEIYRNIPLLLQIFFWYFAVLRTLPIPRQSFNWADAIFLNNRGLYLPNFSWGDFSCYWFDLMIVIPIASLAINYLCKAPQNTLPTSWKRPLNQLMLLAWVVVTVLFFASLNYHLPVLRGFNFRYGISITPEFMALWLALTIYTAAFIAEIVRSGIQSIPKGQMEAARSLALPQTTIIRKIILPQALRVIIPPLTNQHLNLAKNSSLAAAIAYPDLVSVFAGTALNQTGQAVEVIALTMAVYLVLSLTISVLMNWTNAYYSKWGNN